MKILIDGRSILSRKSGIGRYGEELIKGYVRHYGHDSVTVILNDRELQGLECKSIICPYGRHSIIGNIRFSRFLEKQEYDIFHSCDLTGPFWRKKQALHIITVYDLMLFKVRNFCSLPPIKACLRKLKFLFFYRRILRNADIIVSVSESTRKDVKEIYGLNSVVLREGINRLKRQSSSKPGLPIEPDGYFLYVGLAMPHKNVDFLIDTFLESRTDKKLVICGKGHKHISSDRIVYAGFADDSVLDYLYSNCAAFIFPSLYEGFGLPILEALSYHCRVFASDAASLGEFSDKVISFFKPTDKNRLKYLIENCDDIAIDTTGIDKYLEKFEWDDIWDEFHGYLKNYLHGQK